MNKDRLVVEACDFGVIYSLYVARNARARRVSVKISWDETHPDQALETHSCVFELDLAGRRMMALGRKGNQLPPERFSAEKICAWARRELEEFDRAV